MGRQLALDLPKWGGRRAGAGRPRKHARPGLRGTEVPHLRRPDLSKRYPVHVTVRVGPGVGYLRSQRRAALLAQAFRDARLRFGLRIVHYSIQGNHLHLIVEAADAASLSRGMQGLCIRVARRLNALAARRGRVFVDRYHAHALVSRREVANAVRYVLDNFRHHAREPLPRRWLDPLSTAAAPLSAPGTWLLRAMGRAPS